MKYSAHLIICLVLALHLPAAFAGNQNSKPGKNPGSSRLPQQSITSPGNRERQPGNSADQPDDKDREGDRDQDRDWDRDRDLDRDRNQDRDWDRDNDWETERDRELDAGPDRGQAGKGNDRSREMLERRDERKEMKSEYRSDRVPGQEGRDNAPGQQDKSDRAADDENEKKPWYKFWE